MQAKVRMICLALLASAVLGRRVQKTLQGLEGRDDEPTCSEKYKGHKGFTGMLREEADAPKDKCNPEAYYSGVDITSSTALHDRVTKDHIFLPYGHTDDKVCEHVWWALHALDENESDPSKVDLIYSKHPTAKDQVDGTLLWNREHVWPKSYAVACKQKKKSWKNHKKKGYQCKNKNSYVEDNGPFTDIHHLFPSHAGVNSDRSSQYFDTCTVAEGAPEKCDYPGHSHEVDGYTAEDKDAGESKDDRTFWQPPEKTRGVVARALFYMALRYDGEEENTFDLTLADHPSFCHGALGKLDVLKQWHRENQPTEAEKVRNSKACNIQGNRNPFVDHPELVEQLFVAGNDHLVLAEEVSGAKQTECFEGHMKECHESCQGARKEQKCRDRCPLIAKSPRSNYCGGKSKSETPYVMKQEGVCAGILSSPECCGGREKPEPKPKP